MIRRNIRPIRGAFTLVELLVAMGLSVLIMYIMAECSKICLDAVSIARASGKLSTQLQGAGAVMTRDLIYPDHFLRDDTRPGGGVKLSQMRLDWLPGSGVQTYTPPKAGFFRIVSPQSIVNMVDASGNPILMDVNGFAVNSAPNHALHFTSILPAGDKNLYTVTVPAQGGTPYTSRAAEIAYYLVDTGTRTSPGALGQPIYNLVRRQRLVAMTQDEISSLRGAAADTDVIATPIPPVTVLTLADLTNPANRLPIVPNALPPHPLPPGPPLLSFPISHPRFGEDLLLANVLSFEVLVDWDIPKNPPNNVTGSMTPPRTQTSVPPNWEHPFDNLSVNTGRNPNFAGRGVFDTWYGGLTNPNWNPTVGGASAAKLPLAVRVKQIQVTIRIWDPKTKLARQNTWKFSM